MVSQPPTDLSRNPSQSSPQSPSSSTTPAHITVMTDHSKGIVRMPGASSSKAPSFNGNTTELLEFLEQFEDLALSCGLTSREKCRAIAQYIDITTKHFLTSLPGYTNEDYDTLKKQILEYYPGASKGVKYTFKDLERIVAKYAESEITTETTLLTYHHEFRPVVVWLENNDKISEQECNKWFWYGIPPHACRAIARRLEIQDPVKYSCTKPSQLDQVLAAGHIIFADNTFDIDDDDLIARRLNSICTPSSSKMRPYHEDSEDKDRPCYSNAPREVTTRTVHLDHQPPSLDKVKDLGRRMHGLKVTDAAYTGCYIRLATIAPSAIQFVPSLYSQLMPPQTQQAITFVATPSNQVPPLVLQCFMCGERYH